MEALEKLAATNLLISNAKNALFKLKEDEARYLSEREQKTLDKIQKVFEDSETILNNAKKNYAELGELLNTASVLAKFIVEGQENFSKLLSYFDERDTLWQEKVAKKEKELSLLLKRIKAEETVLENERKNIQKAQIALTEQEKKIADKWGEIEREIKRLKDK